MQPISQTLRLDDVLSRILKSELLLRFCSLGRSHRPAVFHVPKLLFAQRFIFGFRRARSAPLVGAAVFSPLAAHIGHESSHRENS